MINVGADPVFPVWLKEISGGIEITLYVQPGAKKIESAGEHNGALKLRIQTPPVEGRANAAVLAFIASIGGVAKRQVTLVAGELNRHKRVRIAAPDTHLVAEKLIQLLR